MQDKKYADDELRRSKDHAKVAGDRHASARATLTKTNRERDSALSEAAKKRDEARSKADAEHASATADDKEESRKIRFDAQKNWDDTRPLKQTKCSNRAKTLEDEADLLREIRHKLDEAGLTTKEEIISQTLSFEGVTAAQLNTSETKNKIADELRNQLKIESPATLEITSIQDRKNKDTTTEETEAKAEETEEAVTLLQIHKSGNSPSELSFGVDVNYEVVVPEGKEAEKYQTRIADITTKKQEKNNEAEGVKNTGITKIIAEAANVEEADITMSASEVQTKKNEVDVDVDLLLEKLGKEQTDNEEEFAQCTSGASTQKKSTKEQARGNDDTEQASAKSQRKTDAMQEQKQFDGKTKSWNERTQKANKKDKQANENLKTKKESNDKAQRDLGIKTEERADALSSAKDERNSARMQADVDRKKHIHDETTRGKKIRGDAEGTHKKKMEKRRNDCNSERVILNDEGKLIDEILEKISGLSTITNAAVGAEDEHNIDTVAAAEKRVEGGDDEESKCPTGKCQQQEEGGQQKDDPMMDGTADAYDLEKPSNACDESMAKCQSRVGKFFEKKKLTKS